MTGARDKRAATKTTFIDTILGGYQSPRTSVPITLRADLLSRFAELQREHTRAIRDDMSEIRDALAPKILRQLKALQDQIAGSTVTITFEAMPAVEYQLLLEAHPPREEDRALRMGYNGETFPPALMAACAIEVGPVGENGEPGERLGPLMTYHDAVKLCAKVSDGQFTKLWNGVLSVNIGDDSAPKGVLRSEPVEQSATSLTTAPSEESPDQSSLAE